jgi:hypothetical protein
MNSPPLYQVAFIVPAANAGILHEWRKSFWGMPEKC